MSETKRRPIPTLGSSPVINGWIQEWGRERAELERVTASLAAALKAKGEADQRADMHERNVARAFRETDSLRAQLAQAREEWVLAKRWIHSEAPGHIVADMDAALSPPSEDEIPTRCHLHAQTDRQCSICAVVAWSGVEREEET